MRKKALSTAVVALALTVAGATSAMAGTACWVYKGASYYTNTADTFVTVSDIEADSKQAEAHYKRGTSSTVYKVIADGGKGDTATSGTSSTKVTSIRACVTNSNPLDKNYCNSYHKP